MGTPKLVLLKGIFVFSTQKERKNSLELEIAFWDPLLISADAE